MVTGSWWWKPELVTNYLYVSNTNYAGLSTIKQLKQQLVSMGGVKNLWFSVGLALVWWMLASLTCLIASWVMRHDLPNNARRWSSHWFMDSCQLGLFLMFVVLHNSATSQSSWTRHHWATSIYCHSFWGYPTVNSVATSSAVEADHLGGSTWSNTKRGSFECEVHAMKRPWWENTSYSQGKIWAEVYTGIE